MRVWVLRRIWITRRGNVDRLKYSPLWPSMYGIHHGRVFCFRYTYHDWRLPVWVIHVKWYHRVWCYRRHRARVREAVEIFFLQPSSSSEWFINERISSTGRKKAPVEILFFLPALPAHLVGYFRLIFVEKFWAKMMLFAMALAWYGQNVLNSILSFLHYSHTHETRSKHYSPCPFFTVRCAQSVFIYVGIGIP